MISIQYLSDIHLETHTNNTSISLFEQILKPSAPYLALCGDIGYPGAQLYEPFLKYCSEKFEHVFYIPGNHEYYNDIKAIKYLKTKQYIEKSLSEDELRRISATFPRETREIRNQKIRDICSKFSNIHFLDKETYQIPNTNIIVVGCTLWSKLDMNPFTLQKFNDFQRICETNDNLLISKTYNKWNEEHVEFLNESLTKIQNESPELKIVVLTHHCPTYDIIIDKYILNDCDNMNSFFANKDLIDLFGKNVKAWICGHTHGCKTINIKGTIIATNTFGYEWETIEGFKNNAILEI